MLAVLAGAVSYRTFAVRPLEDLLYDFRTSRHDDFPPVEIIPTQDKGGAFSDGRVRMQEIYVEGHFSGWIAATQEFVHRRGRTDRIATVCSVLCDRDQSQHGGQEWEARFRQFAVGFEDGYRESESRLHAAAAAHGLEATLAYCERMRDRWDEDEEPARE